MRCGCGRRSPSRRSPSRCARSRSRSPTSATTPRRRATTTADPPRAQPAGGPGREPATARVGYLGLGSNVGDSAGHLRAAVRLLGERGVEVEAVSSTYVTEPVGEVLDQPDFLNAAIRIRTGLEPEALLDLCKEIEAERGRRSGGPRHGPRPLDVDLLLLGDLELESERLRLPHREVTSRRFVLAPLLELDPELALPDGTRLADAWDSLPPGQQVERADPQSSGRKL